MKKPELVAPAGSLDKLKTAIMYGADAVYFGLPEFSLRSRVIKVSNSELAKGIEYAHKQGKKVYVTINIFPHQKHLKKIISYLKKLAKLKPDAIIAADPGVVGLCEKYAPKIRIHLSTQANNVNSESIKFWQKMGVKRIVLARELTLAEIADIKKKAPKMELEVFVHGAMCVSYSGRCLLSAYLTGRDANQGDCAQPCRWRYKVGTLREEFRPDEQMDIEEDKNYTYVMNSKDLCLVEYLDKLQKAGIDAFKTEGRNKSNYYVAVAVRAYHGAIDALGSKSFRKKAKEAKKELETLAHRGYTTGFLFGDARKGEIYKGRAPIKKYIFTGFVLECEDGFCKIDVKNQIKKGDTLEFVTPDEIKREKVKTILDQSKKEVAKIDPGRIDQVAYIGVSNNYSARNVIRKRTTK